MPGEEEIFRPPNNHDVGLPSWGPYSKKYIGISHIPDAKLGHRFDLSVIPGYYRGRVDVPSAKWESGYHPWEATGDLRYYSFRHELEWKDRVYCQVSYTALNECSRLIRAEFVNESEIQQSHVLHYMMNMNFPPLKSYSDEEILPYKVQLSEHAIWIDAMDYAELRYANQRPTDNLVYDGYRRGEKRDHGFVEGTALGQGFGQTPGDEVHYRFVLDQTEADAWMRIRYRAYGGAEKNLETPMMLTINGNIVKSVNFKLSGSFETTDISVGELSAGAQSFNLQALGEDTVELDGFIIGSAYELEQTDFQQVIRNHVPQLIDGPDRNSLILKYDHEATCYGIHWGGETAEIRQFFGDELERSMRMSANDHVKKVYREQGNGHYTNIFMRPIFVQPHASRIIYGFVCCGNPEEVTRMLQQYAKDPKCHEEVYLAAKSAVSNLTPVPAGERYQMSQQLMAATLMTNVVYPIYTRRSYIRHYTPGRWWDCLYTWDSGFIGLGLLELDQNRAIECLNAYLTAPGDPDAAFLHHGSMVPVQHYLYHELWNRTQNRELLAYFYPRLKQYYMFFSGQAGSSTTGSLRSNLLQTWDYFYNSGGWDDYPPQAHVHQNKLQSKTTPSSVTSHAIRIAVILRQAAEELHYNDDIRSYNVDIAKFTDSLQQLAWDEDAGYYSYILHDTQGLPEGILKHDSGANFNMGMDGTYPIIAGICTDEQERTLLDRLMNPERMWTSIGMSAVDRTAPYYKEDGYWNGTVWMAHQWFYWKTMLDLGYADYARQIAITALDLWKANTEQTYNCFEHFIISSGNGAGWHQFGGLSSPVLNWYAAYFRQGRITGGFDLWIRECHFDETCSSLHARIKVKRYQ